MFKRALIDADSLFYTAAYKADVEEGMERLNYLIQSFHDANIAEDLVLCISCRRDEGFRKALFPLYKNLRNKPLPDSLVSLPKLKEAAEKEWSFTSAGGLEADDLLSIFSQSYSNSVMVSKDKDLLTVPGYHIRLNGDCSLGFGPFYRDLFTAKLMLACQIMSGDSNDGIPGVPGVGTITAMKKLSTHYKEVVNKLTKEPFDSINPDLVVPQDAWWDVIVHTYEENGLTESDALLTAKLVYLLNADNIKENKPFTPEYLNV